jgi:hypothetical protein
VPCLNGLFTARGTRHPVHSTLCALLIGLGGCYTYRPVTAPGPEPGARINAELSQDGTSSMVPVLGPEVTEVSGRVVESTEDTLRVSLISVTNQRGIPTSWRGELVPLPRARLNSVGERHLAPAGTALLSAGVLGGLYLLYRLMGGPGVFEGTGGTGGGGGR